MIKEFSVQECVRAEIQDSMIWYNFNQEKKSQFPIINFPKNCSMSLAIVRHLRIHMVRNREERERCTQKLVSLAKQTTKTSLSHMPEREARTNL